jgi:hypothetical protein
MHQGNRAAFLRRVLDLAVPAVGGLSNQCRRYLNRHRGDTDPLDRLDDPSDELQAKDPGCGGCTSFAWVERREWDSNPRYAGRTTVFETARFGHSRIPPGDRIGALRGAPERPPVMRRAGTLYRRRS